MCRVGSLTLSTNQEHKYAQTRTATAKFEYRRRNWLVEGAPPNIVLGHRLVGNWILTREGLTKLATRRADINIDILWRALVPGVSA